jgi:hypothetical protein
VAPLAEIHYTTTLTNAELFTFNRSTETRVSVGNVANRLDVVNRFTAATQSLTITPSTIP